MKIPKDKWLHAIVAMVIFLIAAFWSQHWLIGVAIAMGAGLRNWKIAAAVTNAGYGFAYAAKVFGTSWLDEILIAWAARIGANPDPLSVNVTWSFPETQKYSAAAAAAYTALTTPVAGGGAGWTITCGGQA